MSTRPLKAQGVPPLIYSYVLFTIKSDQAMNKQGSMLAAVQRPVHFVHFLLYKSSDELPFKEAETEDFIYP